MATTATAERKLLLDGEWIETGEWVEVASPYDGSLVARVAKAGAAEARAAVDAAERAMRDPLPAHKRAEILVRVAGALGKRADEVARQITAEAGKPLKAARVEVARAMSTFTMAAVEARTLAGEMVPMDASQAGEGKLAFTQRVPIGVVGAISPFNFPLNLVAHKIAPALAAGCAVVLKPASQTPLSALLLAELEHEAGLPAGWLNVLVGPASEIGDVLVEDERVTLITFTGSAGVGWKLRERAPRKRVNLELGNATPVIVEADADVEDAAARCAANAFSFAGQSCISVQRIYVQRDAYDAFRAAFVPRVEALVVGDPADDATDVGPLITPSERDRVLAWIEEARESGATILTRRPARGRPSPPDGRREAAVRREARVRRGVRPGLHPAAVRHARRGDRRRERDPVRPPGRHLHVEPPDGARGVATAGVRRRDGQRGTDVPRGPDAVRRRQGLRQHARGPGVGGARDDGGAARRRPVVGRGRDYPHPVPLFSRKPPAPAASDLRRERRALLLLREDRLRDLGGLTLEMYRRDQFNEVLVVERCAELIAIEARVSEIDAIVSGAGLRRRQRAICACGAPILIGARYCPSCGRAIDDEDGDGPGEDTAA